MDTEARNRILAEAESWYGTPWRHMARVKGHGVDCAMFLAEVFISAGIIESVAVEAYPQDWHFHRDDERFMNNLLKYADEIDAPETADIALFKFGRSYSHGAIVKYWPLVIHSPINEYVREQDATQGHLAGRDVKFFRVKQ